MYECMNTYSGKIFNPMKITEENVCIEDIAHALSMMCRGCGHVKYLYTVAQHSINCALEARGRGYSKRVEVGCFLHDASEAYIADIIRPVKHHIPEYLPIEEMFLKVIFAKYGLADFTEEEWKLVKEIDDAMLTNEIKFQLSGYEDSVPTPLSSTPDLSEHTHREMEEKFLELAKQYALF